MIPIGVVLAPFGAGYTELREAAQQLDQLGFDSVWVWDHYMSWNDPRESVLECWTTLAGLAEATRRIRLGPLVANNTNRHPGRLAKVAATLHELSGGRLELGIGAGGRAVEQSLFGIDQGDRAARRTVRRRSQSPVGLPRDVPNHCGGIGRNTPRAGTHAHRL